MIRLDCLAPTEWPRWNVSLRLAVALAWPAEPVGVAQPATRRRQGQIPPRCWRLVSERCVRPDRVVVAPPALDDDLGLAESVEDFAVEQFVAQASVEALDVAVSPRGCLARCRRSWHRQPRSIPVLHWRGTPVRCRTGCKRECPAG